MYVLTNKQMREADAYTVQTLGVPSLLLMERAGIALADEAEKLAPDGKIACVCGGGKNGGDGFVCARILKSRGRKTSVVFYAEKQADECRVNMEKWLAIGGEIEKNIPLDSTLLVDCLYGTGYKGRLLNEDMGTVGQINSLKKSGVKVLAADIPSGVNGENGLVEGIAVQADVTLCLGELKTGLFLGDGIDHAGEIKRADIQIQLPSEARYARLMDDAEACALLPTRKRNSHKGTYGRAAIVAGSMEYTGAAWLSAAACLRSGVGYATLFLPSRLLPFYLLKTPELLLKSTNEGDRYVFNEESMRELLHYDSIAYGMGMGISEEVALGATWLLTRYEGKLLLDADGLNSLAAYRKEELAQIFACKKCDVVLTPHCREFSRLTGIGVKELMSDGYAVAQSVAEKWGVTILLKNAVSVLTDGERTTLCAAGCSAQAKGGSGDVLSGIIAGLCATGLSIYDGSALGAHLCGRAAELAAKKYGEYSTTPSDVISYLGGAFLLVTQNANA